MSLPAMWPQPPVAGNQRAPRPSRQDGALAPGSCGSACGEVLGLPPPSEPQLIGSALGRDAQARRKPPLYPAHQLASSLEGKATCIGSAWRAKACAEAHLRLALSVGRSG